ncbi:unnamed protein product [Ranitomeya imitator]|uniref:Uncharacterized protein n=1 Tax=Ranitomeya imitator TaxID=111125 RepID=A0ABN9MES8_9NEOB|nr:unnamed protein product [Ranitomeya imitator]
MLEEDPQLQKRLWVHPLLLLRGAYGNFTKLYQELCRYPVKFVAFCRFSIPGFDNLLHVLRPYLLRQDTCMRFSISPEECLLVTLRFLATGHSYSSLHFEFLLGTSTISVIVRSPCDVIWDKLKSRLMPQPNIQDWLWIAQGFMEATDFPNCIGALDGPVSVEVSAASDTCSSGCVVGVGSAGALVSDAEPSFLRISACRTLRDVAACDWSRERSHGRPRDQSQAATSPRRHRKVLQALIRRKEGSRLVPGRVRGFPILQTYRKSGSEFRYHIQKIADFMADPTQGSGFMKPDFAKSRRLLKVADPFAQP